MSTLEESFSKHWGTDESTALAHERAPYDPVKAREYYLRTRKLKGRKKKAKVVPDDVKKEYQEKLTKFLGSLPMAKKGREDGGKSLKETAAFVNKMRKMSDDEMVKEAKRLVTVPKGKVVSQEAMGQMKTINALLQNRSRVRAAKGTGPKKRVSTRVSEDGSVSKKPFTTRSRSTGPKAPSKGSNAPPKPNTSFKTNRLSPGVVPNRSFETNKLAPGTKMTTAQRLNRLAAKKREQQRQTDRTG